MLVILCPFYMSLNTKVKIIKSIGKKKFWLKNTLKLLCTFWIFATEMPATALLTYCLLLCIVELAGEAFVAVAVCISDMRQATWHDIWPELLKAEVVKSHNCTKLSRICAKFRLLRAKLVKQALFFYDFDAIWLSFNNLTCFYSILSKFLCAKF